MTKRIHTVKARYQMSVEASMDSLKTSSGGGHKEGWMYVFVSLGASVTGKARVGC